MIHDAPNTLAPNSPDTIGCTTLRYSNIGPVHWIPMWILDASWKNMGKPPHVLINQGLKKLNHSIKPWRSKHTFKPRNIWFASEKIKPQNPQAPACRSDHPGATGSRIAWLVTSRMIWDLVGLNGVEWDFKLVTGEFSQFSRVSRGYVQCHIHDSRDKPPSKPCIYGISPGIASGFSWYNEMQNWVNVL